MWFNLVLVLSWTAGRPGGDSCRGGPRGDPGTTTARKAAEETQGTAGTGNGGGSQGSGGRVKKLKEQ